jgi:hypothetical protein
VGFIDLYPLKPKCEREEKVERQTTFNRGRREIFLAMKVPRQCPLVLLVKVG